jgi:hypothetical protein
VLQLISVTIPPKEADKKLTRSRFEVFLGEIPELIQLSMISLKGYEVLRVEEFKLYQDNEAAHNNYFFNEPIYRLSLMEQRVYAGNIRLSEDIGKPIIDVSQTVKVLSTGRIQGILWAVASFRDLPEALHRSASKNGTVGILDKESGHIVYQAGVGTPPLPKELLTTSHSVEEVEHNDIIYTLVTVPVSYQDMNLIDKPISCNAVIPAATIEMVKHRAFTLFCGQDWYCAPTKMVKQSDGCQYA